MFLSCCSGLLQGFPTGGGREEFRLTAEGARFVTAMLQRWQGPQGPQGGAPQGAQGPQGAGDGDWVKWSPLWISTSEGSVGLSDGFVFEHI